MTQKKKWLQKNLQVAVLQNGLTPRRRHSINFDAAAEGRASALRRRQMWQGGMPPNVSGQLGPLATSAHDNVSPEAAVSRLAPKFKLTH
jgi:hypothetical protein